MHRLRRSPCGIQGSGPGQKAAEKEKLEQEMRLRYEEMQKAAKEMEKQPARQPVGTYVKKEQRYEDMNSSASAFFLVGGVLALIAAVSLLGYLPLPLYGVSRILFHVLLILMAARAPSPWPYPRKNLRPG